MNTPKPEQDKNTVFFVKTPNPLFFLYTYLPKYKAEMTTLYGLIVHHYNDKEGYAWPNVDTLALYYGKTERTTSDHLEVLREYGLVDAKKSGNKWHFKPITPLDGDEFFAKFPEAGVEQRKRLKARDAERIRSAENMAKRRAKMMGMDEVAATSEDTTTPSIPPNNHNGASDETDWEW
jgi:DNA-binding transcriptional ArsR family regulator